MSAPTLIVGLGGTGSDIVQQVYDRVQESKNKNISFVVFDTDVNELRVISEKSPEIRTIQTSTKLTVGEYLDIDTFARDTWFPVNRILNGKALTEGAGQVRAISRLALDTAIQQGKMAPLNEAIEDLYKLTGQKLDQAPRVILVGSLCGGTGSGLILPVALYIRNFMTSKLQHGTSNIRGFFLLPEVFDGVIKTQSERNNLRSNAYAAVREINAFMLNDAGTLADRFSPKFYAPRAGSRELDEYKGSPMDFCFLFDAQNLEGQKLSSFSEYKEHAANCIYGMAVAPTSKRSNSSEDNVIREIISSGGKNRFAGAGTSMLIYPDEDIEKYLALNWMKSSISDDWLRIDKRFDLERESVRNRRAKGVQVSDIDRGAHYIRIINELNDEGNTFAKNIRSMCIQYGKNGYVEEGDKWVKYMDNLDQYIKKCVEEEKNDFAEIINDISLAEAAASDAKTEDKEEQYRRWYTNLVSYRNIVKTATQNLASNISYQLFKDPTDFTKDDKHPYRIEYWLHRQGEDNGFIHPNAVRFFMYNTVKALKDYDRTLVSNLDDINDFWSTFEEDTFNIQETEEKETEADYYAKVHMNDTRIQRLIHSKQIKGAIANLDSSFSTYNENINEYWNIYVSHAVYKDAIEYLNQMGQAFESFYDVLGRYIPVLNKQMEHLEDKYAYGDGHALRYVCADKLCLQSMASEIKNPNDSLSLPSELNSRIFTSMKNFAIADKKPDVDDYFRDVFDNTVTGYLKEQIVSNYKQTVHMDVLSAIAKEAEYKGGEDAKNPVLYTAHVLESARLLAKPFIESPAGEEPRVIEACAYNTSLSDENIPGREDFVRKYLKDFGGEADDSIDRNMILFYQAAYRLAACDLSKFAPPRSRETFEREGGEYYKAYYELIAQLNPDTTRSKVITPHIDRWWHVVTKMPDLDDASQELQEKRIFSAFFWGIVGQFIRYKNSVGSRYVYYANKSFLGLSKKDAIDALIVSNGTPCDHLYEVLDAFAIYPRLVDLVLKAKNTRMENDIFNKKPLASTGLYEYMDTFNVQERILNVEADFEIKRSIFDIPMLMKWSVPPEEYHDENMEGLLKTIMLEVRDYISHFCDEKELPNAYSDFLIQQYDLFIENMKIERAALPKLFEDDLFVEITDTVKMELLEYDRDEKVREIDQQVTALRRESKN